MSLNPLNFRYNFNKKTPRFATEFGKELYVANPVIGDILLKLTVSVHLREHGGDCSSCDFDSDTEKKQVVVYIKIPNAFADNIGFMVENSMLVNTDETSMLFKSWSQNSDCCGSCVCGLRDTYIPSSFEYVKIV
jgi:hypothetical protein